MKNSRKKAQKRPATGPKPRPASPVKAVATGTKLARSTKQMRSPMPPRPPRPLGKATCLSDSLLSAWQGAVLELAKLPRGFDKKSLSDDELTMKVARREIANIGDLWEIFTKERSQLSRQLLSSKKQLVGYLLGFHLPNAARMQLALERLDERWHFRELLRTARPWRWHDLGCGSGAAAQAFADFALAAGKKSEAIELHLTDNVGLLLDAARLIFEKSAYAIAVRSHRVPLEKLKPEHFAHQDRQAQLISGYSLGYVWNELGRNQAAKQRLRRIFNNHLNHSEPALILFLEPAQQNFTRPLMELRDELVEAGFAALYPCPASTACPMLKRPKDWCYSEGLWDRPRVTQMLDRDIGIDRSRLSSAIYAFATPALAQLLKARLQGAPVVVGRPELAEKDRENPKIFDYLLCQAGELTKTPAPPGKNFRLRGSVIRD